MWVIILSLLSRSLRSVLYSSSVYSCHHFLISSASVRSIPFLSFIEPIFAWNVPLVSLILFLILLFFSISLHCSLKKAFLPPLLFFVTLHSGGYNLSFSPLPFISLLFSAICKTSSDNHFAFLHLFFGGWFWSPPPVQCYKPLSIVLQALSIRSNPLNLFVTSSV